MSTSDILDPIKHSPILPKLLEDLQWFWHDEQLRRREFYEWLTPNIKAEYVEGEVIMHSPVSIEHNRVTGNLFTAIKVFCNYYMSNAYVGVEKMLTRFTRNDYEPDICYFGAEKAAQFKPSQNIFPVPDFIIEIISKSTEKNDRGIKYTDYEIHKVKEYWIVDPIAQKIEQYILINDIYELQPIVNDTITSVVIPNFSIPLQAVFDEAANATWIKGLNK